MASKDCGMRIRIEKELREAFVQACHAQERAASDVLREFMRVFAAKPEQRDGSIFGGAGSKAG